jgi:hypothetical protein
VIAIVIAFVLAAGLLYLMHGSIKLGGPINRRAAIIFGVAAATVLISGALMYPACNVWQAGRAADAKVRAAEGEADSIKVLTGALGGTENYLNYLKARSDK